MKSSDQGKEVIKKELPLIPKSPGVYRMLNHKGNILYVGKAKNLPNRLKNYVSEKNHIIRTARMLSQTHKIEITTTTNESEALLLEANLIKKFKPKFNILLKDDKSFPFIFIGNKDEWTQITKHRGKKDKEGFYFGPFASAVIKGRLILASVIDESSALAFSDASISLWRACLSCLRSMPCSFLNSSAR